ncbi:MAG TPA: sugar MFS transporter [Cyclobacteriaceae bacterium]|mgnify:CR=1 FL=1|nr:sugar MFS transporter [Cyclobacteriaceae bacterium]HRJ81296.1 sugar MFS transporter [Cyclobacteriaceae bacterium]
MDQKANRYTYSIVIIGVLFFIFGFVTWLNGTLIPFLKLACDLKTDAQALLVTFAFYMAYFFLAIPSSFILTKTGFKKGMALGLLIMAVGALLFVPAANSRSFGLFLTGLFVQGMGLSLLQTASNPYISIIGPIESAAKRISIMGICNKVAGALSPVILSAIVLSGASEIESQINTAVDEQTRLQLMDSLAQRVILPYVIMAGVLILLAVMIRLSSLPEIETESEELSDTQVSKNKTSILQFPHLVLGAICIFVYVGAEVMAGDVIGPYGKALGMSLDETKNFTSYTLWSMVVGYIIGIITIPKYIKQEDALKYSALTGIIFSVLAFFTTGYLSILFIALLGLANSLMWPAIFPLAIDGLGRFTKIGSALLIMGIAGGAIIPQVYGRLIDTDGLAWNSQTAFFWCVLPCYIYILYFSILGHRAGKVKNA